jgi:demethylmenaquinone methyltransferase/2-methoxy-6-polyprenyl-1,4-benzoquinol methylase
MSLRERIVTAEGKRQYVRNLFATIATRYDLITRVLSYDRDRHWKQRVVDLAAPVAGVRALDLATGTGDLAFAISARGGQVTGLDVTPAMIRIASEKAGRRDDPGRRPTFLVGDMVALPFRSNSFDLITTGYGLRNVPDLPVAIVEIHRVLRPGGQAVSLDFNRPRNGMVRLFYLGYLTLVGGALGWLLHRDPDTYRYIPASIRNYPGAEGVAALMRDAGFSHVAHHAVLGGLMAIHHAVK